MESQPQSPEFRINPETFHPCRYLENLTWECSCFFFNLFNELLRRYTCFSS